MRCDPCAFRVSSIAYTRATHTDATSYPDSDQAYPYPGADTDTDVCANANTHIDTNGCAYAHADACAYSSGYSHVCSAGPR